MRLCVCETAPASGIAFLVNFQGDGDEDPPNYLYDAPGGITIADANVVDFDLGGEDVTINSSKQDAMALAVKQLKWTDLRTARTDRLRSTAHTMLSDAPGAWDDWTTFRQEERDLPQTVATKTYPLDSTVGQDDIEIKGKNGCSCDISLEVKDPGSASQSLTLTVTGEDIKVNLATDGSSDITTTVQGVIDAINNDSNSNVLVVASLEVGSTGANTVDTVLAKTDLVSENNIDNVALPIPQSKPKIQGVN